jgi:putative membrane protein|tara:strand:+ start:2534 stop:3694 length:1161 start_codon:yes stop_codon:yes gene_type:complete
LGEQLGHHDQRGYLMARTLVLTVDRDNDLGVKTAIRGPVIGRRQVLTAALKLGIADPEESDTNAMLGALSAHDKILEKKSDEDEVEIAILTGDEKVGIRSDRAVAAQLEEVVAQFQPDKAILITDGAEDESVLPIIQSQVRIDHVEKIIVKQSKGIEGTYYYIVKALEDPKWRAKIMIPFGLVLAVFGLGIMLPNDIGGLLIGGLPMVTGLYILAKGAGIETTVNKVIQEMRENADAAMFSSLLWTATLFSAIFAVAEGWREYTALADQVSQSIVWLEAVHKALAWIVIAFLTSTAGFMLLRLKRGSFSGRLIVLSIFGMVVYSFVDTALEIATDVLGGTAYEFSVGKVLEDLTNPLIWVVVLWMTMTIVRSLQAKQAQAERYWGI